MKFAPVLALFAGLLLSAGCPKEEAKPKMAPAGPAGAKGTADEQIKNNRVPPHLAQRSVTVGKESLLLKSKVEKRDGKLILQGWATSTAPNNTQPEEKSRVAGETAKLLAARNLMMRMEEETGEKLKPGALSSIMKKLKIVDRKEEGDRVSVVVELEVPMGAAGKAGPAKK